MRIENLYKFSDKNEVFELLVGILTTISISLCFILENVSGNGFIILGLNFIILLLLSFKRIKCYQLKGFTLLLLFAVYSLITSGIAENKSFVISMLSSYMLCIVIFYSYYIIAISIRVSFFDLICKACVIVTLVAIGYYGIGTFFNSVFGKERLNNDMLNSNNLGMLAAISVVAAFYKLISQKVISARIVPLIAFMFIGMLSTLASQSRKAIVIIVLGCIGSVIISRVEKIDVKAMFKIFVIMLMFAFFIYYISKLQLFNGINERMEGLISSLTGDGKIDGSTALRNVYRKEAMRQFYLHPYFGIGLDNCRVYIYRLESHNLTYSHCNYAELLCDSGLVGFSIYYLFYFIVLVRILKEKEFWSRYTKFCLGFYCIILVMDYGAVTYGEKSHWIYIVPIVCEMQKLVLIREKPGCRYCFRQNN